jgi:hypothetical protein
MSPNGKLDRKALPDPERAPAENADLLPRSEMERKVAEIWARVLDLPSIGMNENFFDIGGNSLRLARVQHLLATELGVDLRLTTLSQLPTVEVMAAKLVAAEKEGAVQQLTGMRAGSSQEQRSRLLDLRRSRHGRR